MQMTTEIFSTAGMNLSSEIQESKEYIFSITQFLTLSFSFHSPGRNKQHTKKS